MRSDGYAFDVSDMMVMMEALKQNPVRYENEKQNCKYFRFNGIKCVVFDAFDGRK